MSSFVPKALFSTKGVGKHREKLSSFELALRSAGIALCNLVRVTQNVTQSAVGDRTGLSTTVVAAVAVLGADE